MNGATIDAYSVFDATFAIEAPEPWRRRLSTVFAATALPALEAAAVADHSFTVDGPDDGARLVLDGRVLLTGVRSWAVIDRIVWEVNQIAWAAAPDAVLIHAAAVSIDDRAVIICGPSGAGKSTLAAALCVAGGGYLSDEIAAVDVRSLTVRPYPKPLSIRAPMWDTLSVLRPPEWLSPHMPGTWYVPLASATAAPVDLVVVPYHGVGSTAVRDHDRGELLALLSEQTPNLDDRPEALATLERLVDSARGVELAADDLAIACEVVIDLARTARAAAS